MLTLLPLAKEQLQNSCDIPVAFEELEAFTKKLGAEYRFDFSLFD